MAKNDNNHHLSEQEKQLLQMFRELDTKGQRHVILAIESIKTTAEDARRFRW